MSAPYYQDDLVTLYHGDCRDVAPLLGAQSVDFLLTDPPAKALHRRAIGIELDERLCEIAARRLTQDSLFGGAA